MLLDPIYAMDVLDPLADLGEGAGCGNFWGLVEFELELGLAGTELFDGGAGRR